MPFAEEVPVKVRVPVDDNLQPEEIRNLELFAERFVPRIIEELGKGPVLLHCHAGMQRSAAAAAMVLISLGYPSEMAMSYIRYKRPIAFTPVANFLAAIRGYEEHHNAERYKRAMATI